MKALRGVAATLCCTLEQLHRAGVVVEDIKPQNVLLDSCGAPVFADFGISGVVGHTTKIMPTSVRGTFVLTVSMGDQGSPETKLRPMSVNPSNPARRSTRPLTQTVSRRFLILTHEFVNPANLQGQVRSGPTDFSGDRS